MIIKLWSTVFAEYDHDILTNHIEHTFPEFADKWQSECVHFMSDTEFLAPHTSLTRHGYTIGHDVRIVWVRFPPKKQQKHIYLISGTVGINLNP